MHDTANAGMLGCLPGLQEYSRNGLPFKISKLCITALAVRLIWVAALKTSCTLRTCQGDVVLVNSVPLLAAFKRVCVRRKFTLHGRLWWCCSIAFPVAWGSKPCARSALSLPYGSFSIPTSKLMYWYISMGPKWPWLTCEFSRGASQPAPPPASSNLRLCHPRCTSHALSYPDDHWARPQSWLPRLLCVCRVYSGQGCISRVCLCTASSLRCASLGFDLFFTKHVSWSTRYPHLHWTSILCLCLCLCLSPSLFPPFPSLLLA